jgi:hypothetical protein
MTQSNGVSASTSTVIAFPLSVKLVISVPPSSGSSPEPGWQEAHAAYAIYAAEYSVPA